MGTNNVVKTLTEIKSNVPLLKSNAVKTLTEIKKSNMKQNNGVETLRPRGMSYSRTRTRRTVSRSGGEEEEPEPASEEVDEEKTMVDDDVQEEVRTAVVAVVLSPVLHQLPKLL